MSFGLFKNNVTNKLFIYKSYVFYIYMYKQDLALNNQQVLICHKTQQTYKQLFMSTSNKCDWKVWTHIGRYFDKNILQVVCHDAWGEGSM